jgi:GR25 family glycosyltransferase involved in LPS biosynthesis
MYKLFNFPSVNVITIPENEDRLNILKDQFYSYNVKNLNVNLFKKYSPGDCIIEGSYVDKTTQHHMGCITSHLKSIKNWYKNTNEEYAIFCEDDLSLETVSYWNFDWCTFFSALPKNWGCIQLVLVKEYDINNFEKTFQKRNWDQWSACCYMITRSYAKKLLDNYYPNQTFILNYSGIDECRRKSSHICWVYPTSENILYSLLEPVYSCPLFVENMTFSTSTNLFTTKEEYIHQGLGHVNSYNQIMEWWKMGGLNLNAVKNCPDNFI